MFKNKPNFTVTDQDTGKVYWISRAVAVVGVVLFKLGDTIYTPLGLRSKDMQLYPNRWGLPCGYLDWSESGKEAVAREVYEELGLLLHKDWIKDQPDYVDSRPDSFNNENVTLRFVIYREVSKLPLLKPSEETPAVVWSALPCRKDLAFNHNEILTWACSLID